MIDPSMYRKTVKSVSVETELFITHLLILTSLF